METLTASAIATLLLTKMIEKVGENLGEKIPDLGGKALEQIEKLKQVLRHKDPEAASAIERMIDQPELAEQQPEKYGIEVLTGKMESAVKTYPEIAELVEALEKEVRSQLPKEVVQVMASKIKVKGSLKAKKMSQEAEGGSAVNQKMLTDINVDGDINLEYMGQKSKILKKI
jgi:hypothetical protein